MYIYKYIYKYVYISMYIHVYIYIPIRINIKMSNYIYICICISICIYIYIRIYVCISICICMRVLNQPNAVLIHMEGVFLVFPPQLDVSKTTIHGSIDNHMEITVKLIIKDKNMSSKRVYKTRKFKLKAG